MSPLALESFELRLVPSTGSGRQSRQHEPPEFSQAEVRQLPSGADREPRDSRSSQGTAGPQASAVSPPVQRQGRTDDTPAAVASGLQPVALALPAALETPVAPASLPITVGSTPAPDRVNGVPMVALPWREMVLFVSAPVAEPRRDAGDQVRPPKESLRRQPVVWESGVSLFVEGPREQLTGTQTDGTPVPKVVVVPPVEVPSVMPVPSVVAGVQPLAHLLGVELGELDGEVQQLLDRAAGLATVVAEELIGPHWWWWGVAVAAGVGAGLAGWTARRRPVFPHIRGADDVTRIGV